VQGLTGRAPLQKFYGILVLVAAGLAFLGDQFSVQVLMDLAMVCFGALIVAIGMEEIIGRLDMYRGGASNLGQMAGLYQGLAAQLWGLVFILIGLGLVGMILTKWLAPGAASKWSDVIGSRSGIALMLGLMGLMVTLNGLIHMLVGEGPAKPGMLSTLSNVLSRLGGTATFLFGLGMSGVALVLLVAPGFVDAVWARFVAMIVP
jgi:hypothetical protein